jgi:hypothetical protein
VEAPVVEVDGTVVVATTVVVVGGDVTVVVEGRAGGRVVVVRGDVDGGDVGRVTRTTVGAGRTRK